MLQLRQLIIASFLGLAAMLSFTVQAADLIAIIASDTLDEDIGKSVRQDFNHMRSQMKKVADHTGLNLREILMKDKATNTKTFLQNINAIHANKDDVIVFYYGGHGFRTEAKGTSPWPNLVFTQENRGNSKGVEYDFVIYKLMEKHPRLLITMADVCNSFVDEGEAPHLVTRALLSIPNSDQIRNNYKHLFLEEEGMINLTGAKPGEYSVGSDDQGGAFTSAFLASLDSETKNAYVANWKEIIDQAKEKVTADSIRYAKKHGGVQKAEKRGDIQHPYAEINIKNG